MVERRQQLWQHRHMKHNELCAIAHNVADSMASGLAFVIGYYPVDVFGEAANSSDGLIEIDFLRGAVTRGVPSDNLRSAALRFAERLPSFCRESDADVSDFEALSVTFEATPTENRAKIQVSDRAGRSSTTVYAGTPLKRLKVLDNLGRVRRAERHFAPSAI